jgi:hypothetical protein
MMHAPTILNHEWVKIYHYARSLALQPANIISGFRRVGISPFAPISVLKRLPAEPVPPPHPLTPLSMRQEMLLNASPTGPRFREAVAIVKRQMAFRAPLKPAVQVFLGCLMDRTEMLYAELTIAKKEKEEMRVVLEGRKNKKKGKRLVIKNAFILLTQDCQNYYLVSVPCTG